MPNTFLPAKVFANAGLKLLKNNLVMAKLCDSEGVDKAFKAGVGGTVYVKRPPEFIVRRGKDAIPQNIIEGEIPVKCDIQSGVDVAFTSAEETLNVDKLLKSKVLSAAMATIASDIDGELIKRTLEFPNWTGTPGVAMTAPGALFAGAQRLDELAIPGSDRNGILSPGDSYGIAGNLLQLAAQQGDVAGNALKKAKLPVIGNVDWYMTQATPTFVTGNRTATGTLINGAGQNKSYDLVKSTMTQTLDLDGQVTKTYQPGEVFTIAGVNAINPRTKADLGYARQFTVVDAATKTSNGTGNVTLTIFPAIISDPTSPYQNVTAAPADNAAVTFLDAPLPYSSINSLAVQDGDTVRLKRGESNAGLLFQPTWFGSSTGGTRTIGAWGTGANPILDGVASSGLAYTPIGGDVWSAALARPITSSSPEVVWWRISDNEVRLVENRPTSENLSFQWSAGTLTIRLGPGIDPNSQDLRIAADAAPGGNGWYLQTKSNISFENLTFRFWKDQIFAPQGDGNRVRWCSLGYTVDDAWGPGGSGQIFDFNIVEGMGPGRSLVGPLGDMISLHGGTGHTVRYCTLRNSYRYGIRNEMGSGVEICGISIENVNAPLRCIYNSSYPGPATWEVRACTVVGTMDDQQTDLFEIDPNTPSNITINITDCAFSRAGGTRGYAVRNSGLATVNRSGNTAGNGLVGELAP